MGLSNQKLCFAPYQMVKDLRTGEETSDTTGVLDGKLKPLLMHISFRQAKGNKSTEEVLC